MNVIDGCVDEAKALYNNGELKDAAIKIHAIKSQARTIGAYELGEFAEMLEMAAKDEDVKKLDDNVDALFDRCMELRDKIAPIKEEDKIDESSLPEMTREHLSELFEKLNELQMTAYVHHTPVPVEYGSFTAYNNVRRSYGRVVDQGLAVNRELYSGMFAKYPHVRLVHSFLGGAYHAIAQMMMPHGPAKEQALNRFAVENTDIPGQLREHIFFEMSHAQPWGKQGLEFAVKMLGADHILFGSSYPVRKEWLLEGPAFVEALEIKRLQKKGG